MESVVVGGFVDYEWNVCGDLEIFRFEFGEYGGVIRVRYDDVRRFEFFGGDGF